METFRIDWDEFLNMDDDGSMVNVPETECPINYDNLSQSINPQALSESNGIDFFCFNCEIHKQWT